MVFEGIKLLNIYEIVKMIKWKWVRYMCLNVYFVYGFEKFYIDCGLCIKNRIYVRIIFIDKR